jgi:hypothetical protein
VRLKASERYGTEDGRPMRDARRQTPDAKGLSLGVRVCAPPVQDKVGMPRPSHGFGLFSEATSKTGEHSLHMLQLRDHGLDRLFVGHPEKDGDEQMRLQLRSGTQCDVDETAELSIAEAAASLGDVGCDRDRRPPTLRNETESLRLREGLSYSVDAINDNTTSLPNPEFPKVLHPSLVQLMRERRNTYRSDVCRIQPVRRVSRAWRLASGVWRLRSPLDRQPVRPVLRARGLASGVSHLPRIANPSAPSRASGVWRLASGVSSYDPAASPS